MTLRGLLGAMRRRWYAVVAIFAVTAGLTALLAASADGVFTTRTAVSFTYGYETPLTPANSLVDEDVIAFAGAVAADVGGVREVVRYSAADAPYYGAGLREGMFVGLLDHGSQWGPSYGVAVIVVQLVGPTKDWVETRQRDALARIAESVAAHQPQGAEVDIATHIDPLSLRIEQIAPNRLSQLAAFAAMTAAGVLAAAAAAVGTDRVLARGHETRAAGGGPREEDT